MTSPATDSSPSSPLLVRLLQQGRRHLPWSGLLLVVVLLYANSGSFESDWRCSGAVGHYRKASPQETQVLVHRILNNFQQPKQSGPSDTGTSAGSEAPDEIQYWPYDGLDYSDSWAGYNYALALKRFWNKDEILQCLRTVGPRRRVTYAGDSLMRAIYCQTLTDRLEADWADMPPYWPLQRQDVTWNVSSPEGDSSEVVSLSFRFLCNAHPHAEVALRDVLDSDVLVLNSGLWDLSIAGFSDVRFARDYMYGLSHLVAFLQARFHGRVIWRLNPTVDYQRLDDGRKQFYQDSKIRFVNIFSERLMRGAGYEVIDAFSATTGDFAGQGRDDGYHVGPRLTDTLLDLTLNQICDPHGSDFGPTTACEIIEAINREGQINAPRWNGWGLNMSVTEDIPQIQNLTAGHGCKVGESGDRRRRR